MEIIIMMIEMQTGEEWGGWGGCQIIVVVIIIRMIMLIIPVLAAGAGDREVGGCIKKLTSLPFPALCSPPLPQSSPARPPRVLSLTPRVLGGPSNNYLEEAKDPKINAKTAPPSSSRKGVSLPGNG